MISLKERLGIEVPILQAPIGSASSPELVAAVSNAGGLGMLAGTWRSSAELRDAILRIQELTAKPFAINLGVHTAPEEKVDLALDFKVPVISLFWGDARTYFHSIKKRNGKVIVTVGNSVEARAAEDAGADAIIAQGIEAGGHVWGRMNTTSLIPEVCASVKSIPVIAAGGIANREGVAAAIQLEAAGAMLGTRFLLAAESLAHPLYQESLIRAKSDDTFYGEVFNIGWPHAPHRVLANSTVRAYLTGKHCDSDEIVAHAPDGTPIPRFSSRLPVRNMTGDIEAMALYAGTGVGLCDRIQPAADIVRELWPKTSEYL